MDQKKYETILEEYRQLRKEIRVYLKSNDESKNYAIIITLGAFGLDKWVDYPSILFLSAFLICILWYNEIRYMKAIFRAASYIQVFIEKELPELKWETFGQHHIIQKSFIDRLLSNAQIPILLLFNLIFGSIYTIKGSHFQIYILIIPVIILLLMIMLAIKSYITSKGGRAKEVRFWMQCTKEKQL